MARRLIIAAALIVAFGAFFLSDPPSARQLAPTMGLIEHRGQFFRFEDLMDPAYRAASDDPFVKTFAPPSHFAGKAVNPADRSPWAGIQDSGPDLN